jgi:membrane-associated HD superfamily phosphohydrolase
MNFDSPLGRLKRLEAQLIKEGRITSQVGQRVQQMIQDESRKLKKAEVDKIEEAEVYKIQKQISKKEWQEKSKLERQQKHEERIAYLLAHPSEIVTQIEQRDVRRKQRETEEKLARLTQQNILDECSSQGQCKVTEDDLKHAFPKEVSPIGKNIFRPQIDIKEFNKFLLAKKLSFSLPDFVFKKLT